MKKSTGILALSATMAVTLSGCMGWITTATVDGGTGWYAGDYAPYYWSNWNGISHPPLIGNGPGSIFPGAPGPGYYPPHNRPPYATVPGAIPAPRSKAASAATNNSHRKTHLSTVNHAFSALHRGF